VDQDFVKKLATTPADSNYASSFEDLKNLKVINDKTFTNITTSKQNALPKGLVILKKVFS